MQTRRHRQVMWKPRIQLRASADSLAGLFRRLWRVLPNRRRRDVVIAMVWMVISGLSELVTMVLLVPFLVALSAPERLMRMAAVGWLGSLLGMESPQALLLPLTLLLCGAALLGALLRSNALWINSRLAADIGHDLSVTTYASILNAEHTFLLERNSSELITALEAIDQFVGVVFRSLLQMISSLMIAVVVGIALILINPALALILALIASMIYLITSRVASSRLQAVNSRFAALQEDKVRLVQESVAGIRQIRIMGATGSFAERYRNSDAQSRSLEAQANFRANGS